MIATVVTMGFGSFGSVNLLPTIGYSIGAVAAPMNMFAIELIGPSKHRIVLIGP